MGSEHFPSLCFPLALSERNDGVERQCEALRKSCGPKYESLLAEIGRIVSCLGMGHILEKLGGKAQCGAKTGIVNSIPNEPFPSDKLQYFVIRMLIFRENIYSLEEEILMLYPSC